MIQKPFGKLGWPVSAVSMGCWNIGNQWGELDDATAWATVRASYQHGVNLFDTAESYGIPGGLSEMRLGVALAGIRHNVYIVSKIGNWGKRTGAEVPKTTYDLIRLCGHAILGRLHTDYVDVVLPRGRYSRPDGLSGRLRGAQGRRLHPRLWHLD